MTGGVAAIRVESPDGSDDELRKLTRWLRDEDELRGKVEVVHEPLREGHMGGVADVVTVLVTSATAQVLVSSLFGWLEHRRTAGRVSVAVDGEKLAINAGSVEDAERLLRLCRSGSDDA